MDEMVLETQKWLNQTYGAVAGFEAAPENGQTGWATIYALREGLQHEAGITDIGEGFGAATENGVSGILSRLTVGYKGNLVKLIQGAFWCKGINPGDFTGKFSSETQAAISTLQSDAGMSSDGVMTTELMKALFDMSAFTLVPSGSADVRAMQQYLNGHYHIYFGILPCDGIYQRDTNTALIYALQVAEGFGTDSANGFYGPGTVAKTPTLSAGDSGAAVRILQYGLMVNGFYDGPFDGSFSGSVADAVVAFRKFMNLPPISSRADLTVIKGLLTSNGNTSRDSIVCDTSVQLTAASATTVKRNGFDIVGRYLTGTVGVGANRRDKKLTSSEIGAITDAGLSIFPIYQDGGWEEDYFTASQGATDAATATTAARKLGFPSGATVYFAVDVDIEEGNINGTVMPYIQAVYANMGYYKVGIYGTRNVCSHALDAGYASTCFVSDMSTGYSGNLGFKMPKAWAFDQFVEYNLAAGLPIDQGAASGRDNGTSKFNKADTIDSKYVTKKLLGEFGLGEFDYGIEYPLLSIGPVSVKIKADQEISHPNGSKIFKISNGKLPSVDISSWLADEFHLPAAAADLTVEQLNKMAISSEISDGDFTVKVTANSDLKYSVSFIWNVTKFGNEQLTDAVSIAIEIALDLSGFGEAATVIVESLGKAGKVILSAVAIGVAAVVIVWLGADAATVAGAAAVSAAIVAFIVELAKKVSTVI